MVNTLMIIIIQNKMCFQKLKIKQRNINIYIWNF